MSTQFSLPELKYPLVGYTTKQLLAWLEETYLVLFEYRKQEGDNRGRWLYWPSKVEKACCSTLCILNTALLERGIGQDQLLRVQHTVQEDVNS